MKLGIVTLAAAALFAAGSAFAFHCPADMAKIDLPNIPGRLRA